MAVFFTVLTGVGLLLVRQLDWAPQAPFDILGFFWVLSNLGPLLAVAALLLCGGLALYSWFRVVQGVALGPAPRCGSS